LKRMAIKFLRQFAQREQAPRNHAEVLQGAHSYMGGCLEIWLFDMILHSATASFEWRIDFEEIRRRLIKSSKKRDRSKPVDPMPLDDPELARRPLKSRDLDLTGQETRKVLRGTISSPGLQWELEQREVCGRSWCPQHSFRAPGRSQSRPRLSVLCSTPCHWDTDLCKMSRLPRADPTVRLCCPASQFARQDETRVARSSRSSRSDSASLAAMFGLELGMLGTTPQDLSETSWTRCSRNP
jgi:hypothetical protein